MASQARVSGHIRVEERQSARVWIASFTRQDGSKSRKTLGRAWVKDSGRRTQRGAVVWRSANGTKPDDDYRPRARPPTRWPRCCVARTPAAWSLVAGAA
jgi:hypothetical protein